MTVLIALSLGLQVVAVAAYLTGRWSAHRVHGVFAVATGLAGVDCVRGREPLIACWNAAACAYWAWRWWKGGGGNNTRRRLRRLREQFTPPRRTAPAAA
jgi:hypothetical protein